MGRSRHLMSTRNPGHGVMTRFWFWRVSAPALKVLGWGEVVEAGLVTLPVVEDLDELEQVGVSFGSGRRTRSMPRIQAISTFNLAQNDSIAALSNASPTLPNDNPHIRVASGDGKVERRVLRAVIGVVNHVVGCSPSAPAPWSAWTRRARCLGCRWCPSRRSRDGTDPGPRPGAACLPRSGTR